MGVQVFNGSEIAVGLTADTDIAPYLIVKFKAGDQTKCSIATAGDVSCGVTNALQESMVSDGAGGMIKRTVWKAGEKPTIFDNGTVYVKLGAVVNANDFCVPMAGGLGAQLLSSGFTLINIPTIVGRYLKGGAIGDIVPVKMNV